MNKTLFAAALLVLFASAIFAQTDQSKTEPKCRNSEASNTISAKFNQNRAPQAFCQMLAVPDEQNAWTIEIVTGGGLTGAGAGDFAVSSTGVLAFDRASNQSKISSLNLLQPLVEIVTKTDWQRAFAEIDKTANNEFVICSDCITTTIIIRRREAVDRIRTFSASWNDATFNRINADLRRVYEQMIALKPEN